MAGSSQGKEGSNLFLETRIEKDYEQQINLKPYMEGKCCIYSQIDSKWH